jgi:DNA-binding MarR family transcriptional regulator
VKKTSKKSARSTSDQAPFAYEGLDRLIHEHARLSVLTALIANGAGLAFNDLKRMCSLTDGNLSRHLQVLDEAGLITIFKGVEGNRSLTLCRITSEGRKKYIEYLAVLEQVVTDAAGAIEVDGQRRETDKTVRS